MEDSRSIKFTSNIEMRRVYSFEDIPIRTEILETIRNQNTIMKPVPQYTLDHILSNRHLLIISRSGLGRGISTIIGILNTINLSNPMTQALILSPTHALATEYFNDFNTYKGSLKISTVLCIGGTNVQYSALKSQVIVGTSGKILDCLQKNRINLSQLKIIVCDIVNELFNDESIEKTEKILKFVHSNCIHWFLASKRKGGLVKKNYIKYVGDQAIAEIERENGFFESLKFNLRVISSDEEQKDVIQSIASDDGTQSIIFSQDEDQLQYYKHRFIELSPKLLNSKKSDLRKESILENFERGKYNLLLCSDRGKFLRRLNSKRPSKIVFLDIPEKRIFILRIQRYNFMIGDEVFFIIPSIDHESLLNLVSELDIKINVF